MSSNEVAPFVEKVREKDVLRKRSIAHFASAPFFEKVRENLLRLFSKRRPKKTKGGEFSTIPLLFAQPSVANATSLGEYYHPFKRLKASP